jgi:benzylsuccinate CoA-transferase BbsF subunit
MPRRAYLPLRDVRVLSFETAFSLPAATRTLSELGAEVVRATARGRVSSSYITVVDGNALGKACIGVNLKTEEGRAITRRLVDKADVFASNFRPPVMGAFGLGPDDLLVINPGLIVLQISGFGTPGPWTDYPAYGPSTEAAGGMNQLMGREGDPPIRVGSGVYSDQLSARYAALAVITALAERRRTGKGRLIDLSMTEAISHHLGNLLLTAARTGKMPPRLGNRDAEFAPQGVYPCRGDDEWIAISVKDDASWSALVALAGDSRLAEPSLATAAGRRANHDLIDAVLARWTAAFASHDLAARLQEHGIAAAHVAKVSDQVFDPHLRERGLFQVVPHRRPVLGHTAHPHPTTPWLAEGRARARLSDLHDLGADNYRILQRWLGIGRREVRRLHAIGALEQAAIDDVVEPEAGPGVPRDARFAERLELPG